MKILIVIGMLIVFISTFFMLITGDAIFNNAFSCTTEGERSVCTYRGLSGPAAFSIFIIAFFFMIDIVTVYVILTNFS